MVVSVIVLLAGVSIPVITSVLRAAELSAARSVLAGLKAAAEEYEVVTRGRIDHTRATFPSAPGVAVEAADVAGNNTGQLFVFEASRVPTAAAALAAAAKENLRVDVGGGQTAVLGDPGSLTSPNGIVLNDPFGNPIRYAAGVSKPAPDTVFPEDNYLPAHPSPFFASAGPDGLWGEVTDGVPDEDAEDNLYSFDDL